jgi:hypothetical protein
MSVCVEFSLWGVSLLPNLLTLGGLCLGGNFKINFGRDAWKTWRQTWIWDETQHSLYGRRKPHWTLIELAGRSTFRMHPDKANSALPISLLKFTRFQFYLGWTRFDCWPHEFTLWVSPVGHLRTFNTRDVNTLKWGHNRFIPHNHYPISFDDK